MVIIQHPYRMFRYVAEVRECCSPKFWQFYLSLHNQAGVAIDSALRAVKTTFMQAAKNTRDWQLFPSCRRKLMSKLDKVSSFWPQVMHTKDIDLSGFNLPKPVKKLQFRFIDPIYGWIVAAKRQRADDMHWVPDPAFSVTGSREYGGGIQQGKSFAEACDSCPRDTYPMCVSVHWDGTSARGLDATPICVGVANTNSLHVNTQFCVAYMPTLPKMGKTFYNTPLATRVKFYIRQQAVGSILEVLEAAAERGVICRLMNCHGRDVQMVLMPRLLSMNIDQPEAQLFYGMQNKGGCSKCSRRKGFSAFRKCTPQVGTTIKCLYQIFNDKTTTRYRTSAQEKLIRHGFNPHRQCCLHTVTDKLFVRVPRMIEVFPCVDYRDRMHGMFIYLHRCVMESFNRVLWFKTRRGMTITKIKTLLDERLVHLGLQRHFRDPSNNRTYRVLTSVFTDVNMSATDKGCMIFFLPHVLGRRGLLLPEEIRASMLTVIARVQLIYIASRGRRQYTTSELRQIFDEGYIVIFRALEHIYQVYHEHHHEPCEKEDEDSPPRKKFKREHKYVVNTACTDVPSTGVI